MSLRLQRFYYYPSVSHRSFSLVNKLAVVVPESLQFQFGVFAVIGYEELYFNPRGSVALYRTPTSGCEAFPLSVDGLAGIRWVIDFNLSMIDGLIVQFFQFYEKLAAGVLIIVKKETFTSWNRLTRLQQIKQPEIGIESSAIRLGIRRHLPIR